jgi:spermidine/putrescine transport system ATP-binding protein
MKTLVELNQVNKYYGENHIVKNLNLTIGEGEFLTLLGPSGCGKTTTLRMLAGFEDVTAGTILMEGMDIENLEPFERDVNTVFQSYALFPHKTIYDNVAFGLKMKKKSKDEIRKRVNEMLELVQLEGFENRMPHQLSGGQKQRVAIARALINRPKVLLLDEPLGALDLKLRKQMQVELKRLQKKLGITFIYVTHDQEEALTMSDRIAIMNGGVLEQLASPTEIYERPVSKFVADFIGESNIFEASVVTIEEDVLKLSAETGVFKGMNTDFENNEMVYVSIRPEKLIMSLSPVEGFTIRGRVKEHIYLGASVKTIVIMSNSQELKIIQLAGEELVDLNTEVYLYWEITNAVVMHSIAHNIFELIDNIELEKAVDI